MRTNLDETSPNLGEKNGTWPNQPWMTDRSSDLIFEILVLGFHFRISATYSTQGAKRIALSQTKVVTRFAFPKVLGMELVEPRTAFRFPVAHPVVFRVVSLPLRVLLWVVVP